MPDTRSLAMVELEDGAGLWLSALDACEKAAHRGVPAGKAAAVWDQAAVDGCALNTLTLPRRDSLIPFSQRGDRSAVYAPNPSAQGKLSVAGQGRADH